MMFDFEIHRSEQKEHQVHGLKCGSFYIRGCLLAKSIREVKKTAIRMMSIPGVYSLEISDPSEGGEWVSFGPIDTRNPEQASARPKTSNRKPKTGAKR